MFGIARLNTLAKAGAAAGESYFYLKSRDNSSIVFQILGLDSSKNIYVKGVNLGFAMRISPSGTISWQKTHTTINNTSGGVSDSSGNIYFNSLETTSGKMPLIKLSQADGSQTFITNRNLSTATFDTNADIVIDSAGNIYQTVLVSISGTYRIYLIKYNSSGTFSSYNAWTCSSSAFQGQNLYMNIDASDNIYIQATTLGGRFIAKFTTALAVTWSRQINGYAAQYGRPYVDSSGNVYTSASSDFISLDSTGAFRWRKTSSVAFRGLQPDQISMDSLGNLYVIGNSVVSPFYTHILKLNSSDGTLVWSRRLSQKVGAFGGTPSTSSPSIKIIGDIMYITMFTFDGNDQFSYILKLPIDGSLTSTSYTDLNYEVHSSTVSTGSTPTVSTSTLATSLTATTTSTSTKTYSNSTQTASLVTLA